MIFCSTGLRASEVKKRQPFVEEESNKWGKSAAYLSVLTKTGNNGNINILFFFFFTHFFFFRFNVSFFLS